MKRVWVLTSGRTGDDKQSIRLAAALGVPYEEKKIVFNEWARARYLREGPSDRSVDQTRSDSLEAPWPEIVISTGWRQVPVVRWIKQQSHERTRLVQMNRPPGLQYFDLVLAPPQYQVPDRENIIRLDWPLQVPPSQAVLEAASREWEGSLGSYPRPWTVILLGGESHPFQLEMATMSEFFACTFERARKRGGSVMISTSRRTPPSVRKVAREALIANEDRGYLFDWHPESTENPYVAFLADGDEFVITPDSISMLVEVARLGRSISIAPHHEKYSLNKGLRNRFKRVLHGAAEKRPTAFGAWVSDRASLYGLKYARDLASVSRRMVAEGWAENFPNFSDPSKRPLPDEDFDRLVARVQVFLD